jgi:hypothetical protein
MAFDEVVGGWWRWRAWPRPRSAHLEFALQADSLSGVWEGVLMIFSRLNVSA